MKFSRLGLSSALVNRKIVELGHVGNVFWVVSKRLGNYRIDPIRSSLPFLNSAAAV